MTIHKSFVIISKFYLVEKVLYKCSYSNVVEVTVDQQKFGQELKPGNCIVTVSHGLTTLLPHDTWRHTHTRIHTHLEDTLHNTLKT